MCLKNRLLFAPGPRMVRITLLLFQVAEGENKGSLLPALSADPSLQTNDSQHENTEMQALSTWETTPEAKLESPSMDAATELPEAETLVSSTQSPASAQHPENAPVEADKHKEGADNEVPVEEMAAAVGGGSPPVTIRLSFSIEPQKTGSATDIEGAADKEAQIIADQFLLEDSQSASKTIAEHSDILVLEQGQNHTLGSQNNAAVDGTPQSPRNPSDGQTDHAQLPADLQKSEAAFEAVSLSAADLSEKEAEAQDAESVKQDLPTFYAHDMSDLEPEADKANQLSSSSSVEDLQLHITKYAVSHENIKPDDIAVGGVALETELDLESIPVVTSREAGEDGPSDILGGGQDRAGSTDVGGEDLRVVAPAIKEAETPPLAVQQQDEVPAVPEIPETKAATVQPDEAGNSKGGDQLQLVISAEEPHPEIQITVAASSKSQLPAAPTSRTEQDDNVEAASMEQENTSFFKELEITKGKQASAEDEGVMEAQEEEVAQMTASQKRVTFSIPGKIVMKQQKHSR